VRTDGDDECSMTIPLRSAILIASDALIIIGLFNIAAKGWINNMQ